MWIYFKHNNEIVENPPDKPAELVFGAFSDEERFQNYEIDLHKCRTLPVSGNHSWEDEARLEENVDFKIESEWTGEAYGDQLNPQYKMKVEAVPLIKGRFTAVECAGYWSILMSPFYEGVKNILSADEAGDKEAEMYAKLIARLLNKHDAKTRQ